MGGGTRISTSETGPWEEQKPYLLGGFDEAQRLYEEGVPSYYTGQTVADRTPAQKWADQSTIGYAMGPRAAGMQAGAEGSLMGTLQGGQAAQNWGGGLAGALGQSSYGALTPYNQGQYADLLAGRVDTGAGSPYAAMTNALQQGVTSNLQQNILPGIRSQQVQYQPGGSSRANLVQNQAIAKAVQSGLTKPLADMYSGAYQTAQGMRMPAAQMGIGQQQYGMGYGLQGMGAQQASMGQYPSIMDAPFSLYNRMGQVGAQRRGMNQEMINQDMARYNYDANAPQQALANYMNTISGDYGGTTTQTTPGPSGFGQMTNLIGAVAPIAAAFMSDVRVKENITPDGEWKGHNAYQFNYIGDNVRQRGLLAQEVEETRPDAVVEIGGIKHVKYGAL